MNIVYEFTQFCRVLLSSSSCSKGSGLFYGRIIDQIYAEMYLMYSHAEKVTESYGFASTYIHRVLFSHLCWKELHYGEVACVCVKEGLDCN